MEEKSQGSQRMELPSSLKIRKSKRFQYFKLVREEYAHLTVFEKYLSDHSEHFPLSSHLMAGLLGLPPEKKIRFIAAYLLKENIQEQDACALLFYFAHDFVQQEKENISTEQIERSLLPEAITRVLSVSTFSSDSKILCLGSLFQILLRNSLEELPPQLVEECIEILSQPNQPQFPILQCLTVAVFVGILMLNKIPYISLFFTHPTLLQSLVETSFYSSTLTETRARFVSMFSFLVACEEMFLASDEISHLYPEGLSQYLVDKLFKVLLTSRSGNFAGLFKQVLKALEYYVALGDRESRVEELLDTGIIRFIFGHFEQKGMSLNLKHAVMMFLAKLSEIQNPALLARVFDTLDFFDSVLLPLLKNSPYDIPHQFTCSLLSPLQRSLTLNPPLCSRFLESKGLRILEAYLLLPLKMKEVRTYAYLAFETLLQDSFEQDCASILKTSWLGSFLLEMVDKELGGEDILRTSRLLIRTIEWILRNGGENAEEVAYGLSKRQGLMLDAMQSDELRDYQHLQRVLEFIAEEGRDEPPRKEDEGEEAKINI